MAEVININQLAQISTEKMKTKELREFSNAQQQLIDKLQQNNSMLQEKVNYLQRALENKVMPQALPLSSEEIVCMEQIQILKQKSASRELSLDEVKRLDLLVKNLRLVRQQSTQVIESSDYSTLKEAELVAIATSSGEDTNDQ